jgi:hypothetical protein
MDDALREVLDGAIWAALEGTDGSHHDRTLRLALLMERVEAHLLVQVAEHHRSGEHVTRDHAVTMKGWLVAAAGMAGDRAGSLAARAAKLARLPQLQEAVLDGRLCPAKASIVSAAVNPRTRQRFDHDVDELISTVQPLHPNVAALAMRAWTLGADPDGPDPSDPAGNTLHHSKTFDGTWVSRGRCDATTGSMKDAALDAVQEQLEATGHFSRLAELEGIPPTAARRRAEAETEIYRRAMGLDGAMTRPDLVVVVPVEQLGELPMPGPPCRIVGGGPISVREALRLALLSRLHVLLTDGASRVPLDHRREKRRFTPDQRVAAAARWGTCGAPGCQVPATKTAGHHATEWGHFGFTDQANLFPACSGHHDHVVHRLGFTVEPDGRGGFSLLRPDGTEPPPPRYPDPPW